MRKVCLIAVALVASGWAGVRAGAQEAPKSAQVVASKTPTIDQSLEMKSAFNPKISPDGRRVVYEVQSANWEDNSFDRNLWIADIASGELRQLTSAKKSSTGADWSPDGKWIAFISDRPAQISGSTADKKQLYVISADGGGGPAAQQIGNRRWRVRVGAGFAAHCVCRSGSRTKNAEGPQGKIWGVFGGACGLSDGASLDD
jgi:tricorn protease-like protein